VDAGEFPAPERPDGIPAAVWEAVLPRLREELGGTVRDWRPETPGADAANPPPDPGGG